MSSLSWYWHRLLAMSPGEVARHVFKRLRQSADANRTAWPKVDLTCPGVYPTLPKPEQAPDVLRAALRRDVDDILAGRWRIFGHLKLKVDDPPKWQCDYLVGKDLETSASAFQLNYRALPEGADSKLIWEPSRWSQLVRLAMAAHVLGDRRSAEKCVDWLEDWTRHNPPYRGWNWTSALEVGLRLIQFTWIDALLESHEQLRITTDDLRGDIRANATGDRQSEGGSAGTFLKRLVKLRQDILPAHVWYAWRHRSFGSSANNHLLGELTGCIVAIARWPGLVRCGASLQTLETEWRREVFSQFANDGGNREQALNYHLFAWEICWQAFQALKAAGRLFGQVEQRLAYAARFFWEVQARDDHWDYGDSDQASVVPFFITSDRSVAEWHQWFSTPRLSPGLEYWLGEPPAAVPPLKTQRPFATAEFGDWWHYPDSGIAVAESGYWWLRWDLSPLGYLKTAAHAHLDALHLSIWMRGVALIIDPGTGAYHADQQLRNWLASRAAHNGPCPLEDTFPKRRGPFLWETHHQRPRFELRGSLPLATLTLPGGTIQRSVRRIADTDGWEVADSIDSGRGHSGMFVVRWQFAPGAWVKRHSERRFEVHRADVSVMIELDANWAKVELVEPVGGSDPGRRPAVDNANAESLEGVVSPAFRKAVRAPYLKLSARPAEGRADIFTTVFRRG